jgi:hypothetical protein
LATDGLSGSARRLAALPFRERCRRQRTCSGSSLIKHVIIDPGPLCTSARTQPPVGISIGRGVISASKNMSSRARFCCCRLRDKGCQLNHISCHSCQPIHRWSPEAQCCLDIRRRSILNHHHR